LWADKKQDTVTVTINIEIVEYIDNPVPCFQASCEKFNITAIGKSPCEAKQKMIQLIESTEFLQKR